MKVSKLVVGINRAENEVKLTWAIQCHSVLTKRDGYCIGTAHCC